jgi:hypothetical protein
MLGDLLFHEHNISWFCMAWYTLWKFSVASDKHKATDNVLFSSWYSEGYISHVESNINPTWHHTIHVCFVVSWNQDCLQV